MDEVVGLIVEQIAKKMRQAQAEAAAREAGRPATAFGPRKASAAPPVAAAAPAAVPSPPVPAAPRPRPVAAAGADPFATTPGGVTNGPSENALLAAFAGRTGLLAGIVLGEALSPPLALRERESGRS